MTPDAPGAVAGAVVYAKDVARLRTSYTRVLGLAVLDDDPSFTVLAW